MSKRFISLTLAILLVGAGSVLADGARHPPQKPKKPELADAVIGTYFGAVTSDSRGSSKNNVTLMVVKKGPALVLVTSDYKRLGSVLVPLEAMSNRMILAAGGKSTFLYDPTKRPIRLDYSPDGTVAYSGNKQ